MNKKLLIIPAGLLILLSAVGAGLYFRAPQTKLTTAVNVSGAGNVKEFNVTGTNYAFSPNTITVNKGDTVKINFVDADGVHNLVIDGYNVATNIIRDGQDTIEFVADKAGQFEYYCSVGSHRDLGMTGTLIVK